MSGALISAPGSLCAEVGQGLPPFPTPLCPLAASGLRFAPDGFLLTKPNTLPHNRVASVATLRWCSGSSRNAVRLPFGISVQLRRNPHSLTALLDLLDSSATFRHRPHSGLQSDRSRVARGLPGAVHEILGIPGQDERDSGLIPNRIPG